jgi:hypothetical protein
VAAPTGLAVAARARTEWSRADGAKAAAAKAAADLLAESKPTPGLDSYSGAELAEAAVHSLSRSGRAAQHKQHKQPERPEIETRAEPNTSKGRIKGAAQLYSSALHRGDVPPYSSDAAEFAPTPALLQERIRKQQQDLQPPTESASMAVPPSLQALMPRDSGEALEHGSGTGPEPQLQLTPQVQVGIHPSPGAASPERLDPPDRPGAGWIPPRGGVVPIKDQELQQAAPPPPPPAPLPGTVPWWPERRLSWAVLFVILGLCACCCCIGGAMQQPTHTRPRRPRGRAWSTSETPRGATSREA